MSLAPVRSDIVPRAAPFWVRAIDAVGLVCAIAAAVMLTAAVLVVSYMVVHRALGASAFWEIELAVYLMVGAIFLASPYTLRTKGHVNVDLLDVLLAERAKRAVAYSTAAVGCAVCLYLAWHGWKLFHEAWVTGETSESMWKPVRWPLYLAMPVGLTLTALQYAAEVWKIGVRGRS